MFVSGKCVYERGRDRPWEGCQEGGEGPASVTRTKTLKLAKVRGEVRDCPQVKVIAKPCPKNKKGKNKKKKKGKKGKKDRKGSRNNRKKKNGELFKALLTCQVQRSFCTGDTIISLSENNNKGRKKESSRKPADRQDGGDGSSDNDGKGGGGGGENVVVNPVCTLDLSVNGEELGSVSLLLRADKVPKTAENFR